MLGHIIVVVVAAGRVVISFIISVITSVVTSVVIPEEGRVPVHMHACT